MKETLSRLRTSELLALLTCLILALAVRLPDLTVFLTADEARSWFGRSIIFLDSVSRGDWANTAPGGTVPYLDNLSLSPAPGVTTMWAGAIGLLLEYFHQGAALPLTDFLRTLPFDPLEPAILLPLRLPGVLISVMAVGLTLWWSRPILGLGGAVLAAGLIALDPFHLALTRVLGHDAFVATFMWLSLLAMIRACISVAESTADKPAPFVNYFLILSGIFGGLAVLSKYPALFMAAFVGLIWLITLARRRPIFSLMVSWFKGLSIWAIVFIITVILLWPAMWVEPLNLPVTIISDALRASGNAHQKGSFFLGQPVADPGALFYPLVALFRLSPVILIGLLGLLLFLWPHSPDELSADRRQLRQRQLQAVLILLVYGLLYTLLVTYGGKKQDRYLLPIFPALNFLAALGYWQIVCLLQNWLSSFSIFGNDEVRSRGLSRFWPAEADITNLTAWQSIPYLLLLAVQLAVILPAHPYYFSFYNPWLGGAPAAAQLMQVGWGEGLDQAAAYLNTLPEIETQQAVSWYSTTFEPYFDGQTIYKIDEAKISRDPKPGLAADYLILYINQLQRQLPSDGALTYFRQPTPLHVVRLNGLAYAWLYPAPSVSQVISGSARLVGQAELLAFEWFSEADQPLTDLPSGTVPRLRLYWEWQGKSADEPLRLSVADEAGHTVGWANLIRSTEAEVIKEDGAIITSDYAMPIFPGTMPGDYYLTVWIDRPATGEVVGKFPLSPVDRLVRVSPPITPAQATDFEIRQPRQLDVGSLRLIGYNLADELWLPTEARTLELFWTKRPSTEPDSSSLTPELSLILTPQSDYHHNQAEYAIPWTYPPDKWQLGDHFRQLVRLTLPPYLPPGAYDLQLRQTALTLGQVDLGGREREFKSPAISQPLTVQLGDSIQLLGYELPSTPPFQSPLKLTLYWQALQTPVADYTVFVQLLDEHHQVVAQQDQTPQAGNAPTSSWAVGEIVTDSYQLPFAAPPAATYRLIAGMYLPATGERLPLVNSEHETDAIILTTFSSSDD